MHHLLNVPWPSCLLPMMPHQTFSSLKSQLKCHFFREVAWIFIRNSSLLSSVLPQPLALSLFPLCLVSGARVFLDCGPHRGQGWTSATLSLQHLAGLACGGWVEGNNGVLQRWCSGAANFRSRAPCPWQPFPPLSCMLSFPSDVSAICIAVHG